MDQKGLTLLETVLVLFLIGVIFLFIMNFYGSYFESSNKIGEYEQAKSLVVKSLEEEKMLYKESSSYSEFSNKLVNSYERGSDTYRVYSTVKDITENGDLNSNHGLVELLVYVKWDNKELEVKNYVSKK